MKNRSTLLVTGLVLATSCSRTEHTSISSEGGRHRLSASLFPGDQAVMSNEQIGQILDGRVDLAKEARLAIFRLNAADPYDPAAVRKLSDELLEATRVRTVSVLPSMLTPQKIGIPSLRAAAARMQADFLAIYGSSTDVYETYNVFSPNEVKTVATVELILLDVRTGTIPFSSVVRETFEGKKSEQDVNFNETVKKGTEAAVTGALAQSSKDLLVFLERTP